MKTAMLSAVTDQVLKNELRALFLDYPFEEMSAEYSIQENCNGICFADCSIYILPSKKPQYLLSVYLHEVAHATLIRAGHPHSFDHGYDFSQICRELQLRFGVSEQAWHEYDQSDSPLKTTHKESVMRARQAAMQIAYDPTLRALHLADEAKGYEWRHGLHRLIVILAPVGLVYAALFADWSKIFGSLSRSDVILCSGLALAGWLWFSLRGRD